jgi:formiminotetrahydrofolate cyclodeaminase
MAAFKLPQGNSDETKQRETAIQAATKGAAEVPLQVAERAVALFERLVQLEAVAAASMRSDLQVARFMAAAGARGALANVEINLDGITDSTFVASTRTKMVALRGRLDSAHQPISA